MDEYVLFNLVILRALNHQNFTMRITTRHALAIGTAILYSSIALAQPLNLITKAEQTQFEETGRYSEVEQLCKNFAISFPKQVRCFTFGITPEGRAMWALAANSQGITTAELARKAKLPVSLFQGGIHAGEIDGKDAGFLVLRELLQKPGNDNPLNKQVMLFVPVFNVDGHERFKAFNRPNQRGPKEMGWRTTGQNFNLNRDYAKADTPEMQAMLALVNTWDPLFYVDLHVTNGAKFQHDISVQIEPIYAGDANLRAISKQYQDTMMLDLKKSGTMPLPFYPSFIEHDNPASGFADSVSPPRFSTGYFFLRNRFGVLVETHSWKTYPVRVKATAETIRSTLKQVATHGTQWQAAVHAADQSSKLLAGKNVALEYKTEKTAKQIEFQGYKYTRSPSEVSGALMTRYDESQPEVWNIPLYNDITPNLSVAAPKAGYIVPPAFAGFVEARLKTHGISSERISKPVSNIVLEQFNTATVTFSPASFESHQPLKITGNWQKQKLEIAAGSLFVPIAQAKSALVMALLEPQAPDSYLAWGFFNNSFERKEYMEDYVAEEVARDMLANNPALQKEFDEKMKDKAFADSPQKRLEFFARLHSSWDDRYQVYPVLRTDQLL